MVTRALAQHQRGTVLEQKQHRQKMLGDLVDPLPPAQFDRQVSAGGGALQQKLGQSPALIKRKARRQFGRACLPPVELTKQHQAIKQAVLAAPALRLKGGTWRGCILRGARCHAFRHITVC
ncbi:hypothetical protein D3C87_1782110 [compost metagenome]